MKLCRSWAELTAWANILGGHLSSQAASGCTQTFLPARG